MLRLEVDGLGAAALFVTPEGGAWRGTFFLPPGLDAGWHTVRMRFADSGWGREFRIAVDMPLTVERIELKDVYDGVAWTRGEVRVSERGFLSCWASGLPENADRDNVRVELGGRRLQVNYVGDPDSECFRQINAEVPGDAAKGEQELRVKCAGTGTAAYLTVK